MKRLRVNLIGRWGNTLFQWCAAKRLAEIKGLKLSCDPWLGEKVFDIPEACRETSPDDEVFEGYGQRQEDLRYYRKWCKDTLKLKPEIEAKLNDSQYGFEIVAHRRVGDYAALGYPVVSEKSYHDAAKQFIGDHYIFKWITEESPETHPHFTGELSFVPDFYAMMKAKVLFRGNSSFSWWAATLSNAEVYAPIIEGLEGGKEHDCAFVPGNWPRLANLEFTTDLRLPE